jgi:zinc transport system substrate-binding protein
MRIIPVSGTALVLAGALLAGACGPASPDDGKVHVVASFYPLAEAAAKVGGADVAVENLTRPGAEPHDLELSTRQVDDLLDADLAVVMGRGFQPDVEDTADHRDGGTVVALDALGLGGKVSEEGTGLDPHVWLDPARMQDIVVAVADGLAKAEPEQEPAFGLRAAVFGHEIDDLIARYRTGLATCRSRTIVTSHAAFGWLAKAFGLEQESISGLSPEQEPDPRRLARLVDLVRDRHVTTVFTESLVSPKVAETLAREAGVRTAVLDPLEGLSKARIGAGEDYVSVMDDNLAKLRTALGCT